MEIGRIHGRYLEDSFREILILLSLQADKCICIGTLASYGRNDCHTKANDPFLGPRPAIA